MRGSKSDNIDAILISRDPELRAAAERHRPPGKRLQLFYPENVTDIATAHPAQTWIDLDDAPNDLTFAAETQRVYFYSSIRATEPRPPGFFVAKSAAATALALLWASLEGAAPTVPALGKTPRLQDETEVALPRWALDLNTLDLRDFCRRVVSTLPNRCGYLGGAIYAFDASRQLLTLTESTGEARLELAIRAASLDTHWLGPAIASGCGTMISDASGAGSRVPWPAFVLPLFGEATLVGVLVLFGGSSPTAPAFSNVTTSFLGRCLDHAILFDAAQIEARVDCLTGLFNQRWMGEALTRETQRSQRHGDALSAIMVDLDGLKPVNDQHGHAAGDRVLKHVAGRILSVLRQSDAAARMGGDEFVVLLPATDAAGARMVAERILQAVQSDEAALGESHVTIGVSIGVSTWQRGWDGPRLLDAADQAMYCAKRSGRNQVVCASSELIET